VRLWLALAFVVGSSVACSVPRDAGFAEVRDTVRERSGYGIKWYRGAVSEQAIRDEVRRLIGSPLTTATAIKVALINNRRLQATYEQLGIAQADLVQAGMLDNPSLGVGVLFPVAGSLSPDLDLDFGMNFLSIFTMAARERIAGARLQQAKLRVGDAALDLVSEVRSAMYSFQAAQQLMRVDLTIAQAAEASYLSAVAFHDAGNIDDLQLAQEQAQYEGARLGWLQSMSELAAARERLNRAMGLWGTDAYSWRVEQMLPGVPRDEVALERLESLAIGRRLDLAAAIAHTQELIHRLGMAEDWGWLHGAEVGAGFHRDHHGDVMLGPTAGLELPIFDQGQAQSARLLAMLRQSRGEVTALAVDIRSDVRLLREQLLTQRRRAAHYRDVVIPLRERIVKLTLEQYGFMLVGVFELLEKKRDEVEAYHGYIHAVRDYWIARSELRRAVGGSLPKVVRPNMLPPPAAPPTMPP